MMSESKLPLAGIIILLSTIPHQEFTNIALKINSTNISKICRVKISNKLQNTREIYLRLPQAMKEIHPTSYQQKTDSFSQVDCTCSILTYSSLIKLKNNIHILPGAGEVFQAGIRDGVMLMLELSILRLAAAQASAKVFMTLFMSISRLSIKF